MIHIQTFVVYGRLYKKQQNADLVVDEVVQRRHRPDEGRDVDDQMHVVGLDQHGSDQLVHVEVREQVEDVLHVVHDLPRYGGKGARTVTTKRRKNK